MQVLKVLFNYTTQEAKLMFSVVPATYHSLLNLAESDVRHRINIVNFDKIGFNQTGMLK